MRLYRLAARPRLHIVLFRQRPDGFIRPDGLRAVTKTEGNILQKNIQHRHHLWIYIFKLKIMEVTAGVLYDGALAHYEVDIRGDRECYAQLSNYNGNPTHKPPHAIRLRKEGRHWVSSDADQHLSDDRAERESAGSLRLDAAHHRQGARAARVSGR